LIRFLPFFPPLGFSGCVFPVFPLTLFLLHPFTPCIVFFVAPIHPGPHSFVRPPGPRPVFPVLLNPLPSVKPCPNFLRPVRRQTPLPPFGPPPCSTLKTLVPLRPADPPFSFTNSFLLSPLAGRPLLGIFCISLGLSLSPSLSSYDVPVSFDTNTTAVTHFYSVPGPRRSLFWHLLFSCCGPLEFPRTRSARYGFGLAPEKSRCLREDIPPPVVFPLDVFFEFSWRLPDGPLLRGCALGKRTDNPRFPAGAADCLD